MVTLAARPVDDEDAKMAVNDERGRVQQSSIVVQKRRPLTVRICLLHWQAKAILGNPKSERLPNIDLCHASQGLVHWL